MITFQVNEKITFLSEKGEGTIIAVLGGNFYLVLDEAGFERKYSSTDLVKIHGTHYTFSETLFVPDNISLVKNKLIDLKERGSSDTKSLDVWEIDLHIEALVESTGGMSNSEILERQMREFKAFYNKALQKRVRRLVIIHGVGEGILKQEIRDFLTGKSGISYYDADFRYYGKGATEVEVRYTQLDF